MLSKWTMTSKRVKVLFFISLLLNMIVIGSAFTMLGGFLWHANSFHQLEEMVEGNPQLEGMRDKHLTQFKLYRKQFRSVRLDLSEALQAEPFNETKYDSAITTMRKLGDDVFNSIEEMAQHIKALEPEQRKQIGKWIKRSKRHHGKHHDNDDDHY